MDETSVMRRVWLRLSSVATLFRVNTGKAWVSSGGKPQRLPNGSVILPYARPIALGFSLVNGDPVEGTSDLVGFSPIKITAAMVGYTLPVFTAFECKESGGGARRAAQEHFVAVVKAAGGIAAIVSSPESAQGAYQEFVEQFVPF
jgi:hypothetical protein